MKKIFTLLSCLSLSVAASAQLTVTADTITSAIGINSSAYGRITINNPSNNAVTVTWNADVPKCVIPTGFNVIGLCFEPGLCYAYNGNLHSETIPAKATGAIKIDMVTNATPNIANPGYVVINTDINGGKELVFKYVGLNWPNAVSNNSLNEAISITPNPASNQIKVKANDVANYKIYSINGNTITNTTAIGSNMEMLINTSALSTGLYFIQLSNTRNEVIGVKSFVIQ
jgi:hypothetical protein